MLFSEASLIGYQHGEPLSYGFRTSFGVHWEPDNEIPLAGRLALLCCRIAATWTLIPGVPRGDIYSATTGEDFDTASSLGHRNPGGFLARELHG